MEEGFGKWWHGLITRAADRDFVAAAVRLEQVQKGAGVWFRALGGDAGCAILPATSEAGGWWRSWAERLAGSGRRMELAWLEEGALRLPTRLACCPEAGENLALYHWLAGLAAMGGPVEEPWIKAQQGRVLALLARCPGLGARYRMLVRRHLAQRPEPERLSPAAAVVEQALRQALTLPGSVTALPHDDQPFYPVALWLHPNPPFRGVAAEPSPKAGEASAARSQNSASTGLRKRGYRVKEGAKTGGLLAFRLESLFSWTEYLPVDRPMDDSPDGDAVKAAEDLDSLATAPDGGTLSARVRLDLDLPVSGAEDRPMGSGILLPEWDDRSQRLRPDWCRVLPMLAASAAPQPLPESLRASAKKLRRQFASLTPERRWHSGQPEGSEVDLDGWIGHCAERVQGRSASDARLYRERVAIGRDISCLLLADLSMSTDAWVAESGRVIDIIQESLLLFCEALSATEDPFALYGFSSRNRDDVRFTQIKGFAEPYDAHIRGRIHSLRPGYYTRMGAAIRQAQRILEQQPSRQRLLLLLTDGKPNDLDLYEGAYGIADTRHAVQNARRAGLKLFCVTIDQEAKSYLPHLFGAGGAVVINNARRLPSVLPGLYARWTG